MNNERNGMIPVPASLEMATGAIPYTMTNDYMFRAVLQENQEVLKGLVCSLLHLDEADVASIRIQNPIVLGESIADKEFRLDILVLLNEHETINLEMQVCDLHDWPNRSLVYLCRSFDKQSHGSPYIDMKPAIHIGFLDYTLFNDAPEFYATYKMMNVKNGYIYNDNFVLSVIDLNCIDLATREDLAYGIDKWARLFKASTWDELKAVATSNNYLKGAVDTIYMLSTEELIQKRCRDREDYLNDMKRFAEDEKRIAEMTEIIAKKDNTIAEKDNAIAEKDNAIAEKDNAIAEKDAEIALLRAKLATIKV